MLRALCPCLLALASCGAGATIQRGINLYYGTDYMAAMQVWGELEAQEGTMNDKGLVRYSIYRGLTAYRLGHRQAAVAYLTRGRNLYYGGSRSWLPQQTVQEMEAALQDLYRTGPPQPGIQPQPGVQPQPPGEPAPPAAEPAPPVEIQ